jgi:TRAP-type C4-dicarboxylate transport system permease small subunit
VQADTEKRTEGGKQQTMKRATKLINSLCRWVSYVSMAATVVIMLLVVVDVACRSLFNKPIIGVYDVVTLLMTVLVFSSWSYAQTEHAHVHVTMFVGKMPKTCRFVTFGLTSVLSTGYMVYATWAAYEQTLANYSGNSHSGTVAIPYWPFSALQCVAFVFFTLTLLLDTVKTFCALFRRDIAEEIQSYWA